MANKTNKIKLPKYSSYLTEIDSELLDSFCELHHCSKAKALTLLLSFWNNNKHIVSNSLATFSNEDLPVKKYDEQLAILENKLALFNYDEKLATINNRLTNLENQLTTTFEDNLVLTNGNISPSTTQDNSVPTDNDILIQEFEDNSATDVDQNLVAKFDKSLKEIEETQTNLSLNILDSIDDNNTTLKTTLSESPTMPLKEDTFMINQKTENDLVNDGITQNHTEIGTLKDAIDNIIIPQFKKGTRPVDIAKMLDGKYKSSLRGKSTQWTHTHITRAVKAHDSGKV